MLVLGCDPGTTESSFVVYDGQRVLESVELPNDAALDFLRRRTTRPFISSDPDGIDVFAIEQIEAMGMAVGRDVFETVWWSGRFVERVKCEFHRVTRRQVKLHLCGSMRAKDPNVRQALIDKIGPVGKPSKPGPLYGISKHKWSALAVAVTYYDTREEYRLPEPKLAATTEEF